MHRIDRSCNGCGELPPRVRVDLAWTRRAAAAALALTVAGAVWRLAPTAVTVARGDRPEAPAAVRERAAPTQPADAPVVAVLPPAAPASSPIMDRERSPGEPSPVTAGLPVPTDSITWVPAVARTWVNVRADASRGGEVVGVIKPSARAMLGSNRAGWRQVRSPDAVGWADPRLFEPDSTRPRGD